MNKKFLLLGGGAFALLLAVYLGLTLFLGSVVKAGVNTFGPKLTQTEVTLAAASLSPLSGSGTLTGLAVGNPKGWSDGRAFYLGRVHVSLAPFSIFGDHIVINEITIDQPEFTYETKIVASNIKDLLKNIEAFTGTPTPETKAGKPIKFVVKKFRLTNGKAVLGVGAAALPLPLPPISLDDLGVAEGGITPDQLVGAVMKQVLGGIVTATSQALGKVGSTAGATAADTAAKAGEGLKRLFGGKPKP